jgi:hypothetical protein
MTERQNRSLLLSYRHDDWERKFNIITSLLPSALYSNWNAENEFSIEPEWINVSADCQIERCHWTAFNRDVAVQTFTSKKILNWIIIIDLCSKSNCTIGSSAKIIRISDESENLCVIKRRLRNGLIHHCLQW